MAKTMQCAINPRYFVFKVKPRTVEGSNFVIDCEVRLKLTPATAKKVGREFGKALGVYPKVDPRRPRRSLMLQMPVGSSHECLFTRAVGFSCLKYKGRQLRSNFGKFEIDHVHRKKKENCCLSNLQILTKEQHLKKTKKELYPKVKKKPASRR